MAIIFHHSSKKKQLNKLIMISDNVEKGNDLAVADI